MELNDSAVAIEACLAAGVGEFVICGGARNVELVVGLASLGNSVRLWSYPEERSAAFFALGRSRASGGPVAVVTTSGTAVAELLPAAVEAHYASVPLVLVTADRPERFRGSGAPQAIEQVGIFAEYAADEIEGWERDRPLHLNVCLEEPTGEAVAKSATPSGDAGTVCSTEAARRGERSDARRLEEFLRGDGDLVVMLGCLPEGWRKPVRTFVERLGAPVIAEATSGLREAGFAMGGEGGRVLRIGGVPSCRAWRDLETSEVPVFSVAPNGLPGLARASEVVRAVEWESVEVEPCGGSLAPAAKAEPKTEESRWVRGLSERVPEGSLVFLGNSLPIREWNEFATYQNRGLRCVANRGANGIDGLVSTFLGMAEGEEEAWLVLGDLSTVYDLAAPWVLPQLSAGNRRIVVINNGGGKIFRKLPALASASERAMVLIENPHALRFQSWAEMWGMAYREVAAVEDLGALPSGNVVVEIVV